MQRHEILEKQLRETREDTLRILAREGALHDEQTAPGKPHQQFARAVQMDAFVSYAVFEHLGYGPVEGLVDRLNTGVDRAVEYFFGDWWRGDADDSRALDKTRPDRELAWLGVLPHALLLCGLTGRWEDAAKICSWFEASIQMEYRFELNDYEYQWLYLCIVSSLRPEPLEGLDVESTLATLQRCRPKHPRLLGRVWEAVLAGDQKEFNHALKASVQHFLKAGAQNVPNWNFWVARDESLMWLVAEKRGLRFPCLPERPDAAVVRRQTTGLG